MSRQYDEDKRERILAAALEAFGESGFSTATMKEIAMRAEIAPGSIYTYFQDKDELFRCAVDDAWQQFHRGMDHIFGSSRTPIEKMTALMDFGFDLLKSLHPLLRGMFSEANRQDLFRRNLDDVCLRLDGLFATPEFAPTSPARTPKERHFFVRTTVAGILFQAAIIPPESLDETLVEMKEQVSNTYFAGISSPVQHSGGSA